MLNFFWPGEDSFVAFSVTFYSVLVKLLGGNSQVRGSHLEEVRRYEEVPDDDEVGQTLYRDSPRAAKLHTAGSHMNKSPSTKLIPQATLVVLSYVLLLLLLSAPEGLQQSCVQTVGSLKTFKTLRSCCSLQRRIIFCRIPVAISMTFTDALRINYMIFAFKKSQRSEVCEILLNPIFVTS